MTRAWVAAVAVAVLGVLGHAVYEKEALLAGGETIYLELAPRDPRSLMQGDYMRLRYRVVRGLPAPPARSGLLVVRLDDRGVASFARYDGGEQLEPRERRLRYRARGRRVRIAPEAFFFQEGHAERYQRAAYGVFRLGADGALLLAGLADSALVPLGGD